MNILIFGADGFIGSNFLELLNKKKYKFFSVHKSKNFYVKKNKIFMNLINKSHYENLIQKGIKPGIIYNFAWHKIKKLDKKNSLINFNMNKFIIDYANIIQCKKLIFTGSCFEYGDISGTVKENVKIKKLSIFGFYKRKIMTYSFKKFKNITIWTRLFYVYGNRQKNNSLIPLILSHIKKKKVFICKRPYDSLDYINVKDVCKILLKCSKVNSSQVINISSNNYVMNKDIIDLFKKFYKEKFLYKFNNKVKKNKKFKGENSKIKKLGIKKFVSIKNGVKKYINEN